MTSQPASAIRVTAQTTSGSTVSFNYISGDDDCTNTQTSNVSGSTTLPAFAAIVSSTCQAINSMAFDDSNTAFFSTQNVSGSLQIAENSHKPSSSGKKDVPEPTTILGTLMAAGYGYIRHRKNKLKSE